MSEKAIAFVAKNRQPIFCALLGVVAGVLPSIFNHMGEFWRWSFWAKTASYFGFWVIFVVLIIMKSKSRKMAVWNVVLFCFMMCVAYGVAETVYKIPMWAAGDLSTNNIFGNNPVGLFFEYEFGQVVWFAVIVALIPISKLIYDFLNKKVTTGVKITVNLLIFAPLLVEVVRLISRISNPVIVCADLSNGWAPDVCTFQSPDAWIVTNMMVEMTIYVAFMVFWVVYAKKRGKGRAVSV